MPRLTTPDLDLSSLYELSVEEPKMTKQASATKLKLAENSQRFTKIGFDLFRDSESDFIWKLEADVETGEEYIIRTASVDERFQSSDAWSAQADKKKTAITLVYKGHAIKAFKKAELNFKDNNVEDWRKYLVDKITSDPSFLGQVLEHVGESRKKYILGKFPELGK